MLEVRYKRLSDADREAIRRGLGAGLSCSAIAHEVGRVTNTVSREVARNYGRRLYRAVPAGRKAHKLMGYRRAGKRKLWTNGRLRSYVEARLTKAWSPEEISRRLLSDYADDRSMRISGEAIYQYIYNLPRGGLKATLIKGLR